VIELLTDLQNFMSFGLFAIYKAMRWR